MREPYVEGSSDPPRPRVMAVCPRGHAASVDRGHAGQPLSSEITFSGAPTSFPDREGNRMCGAFASRTIRPAESKTLRMRESSMHENREIPSVLAGRPRRLAAGRSGKACGRNPDVYAAGKSDRPIVPRKLPNKPGAAASGAEEAEGRGLAKEKTLRQNPPIGHSAIPGWSNAAKRIRQAATPVRSIQGRSRMR